MKRIKHIFLHVDFLYYLTPDGQRFYRACRLVHDFTDAVIQKRRRTLISQGSQEFLKTKTKAKTLDFIDGLLLATVGFLCACVHAKSLQSCTTLCDPIDCIPPGSSVHGILQARMLEWVAMPSSRGSSQLRNQSMSPAAPALRADSLLLSQPESLKVGSSGISIQEVDWILVSKV